MDKWLKAAGAAAASAAALLLRSEYERGHLETVRYEVYTDRLAEAWDGYSIAFLSDLHDNCFGRGNSGLLEAVKECRPDIVLIGGDMPTVKKWRKKGFDELGRLLKSLSFEYPVYYALGNHEQRMLEEASEYPGWWEDFCSAVGAAGVTLLIDSTKRIEKDGRAVAVSGVVLSKGFYRKGKVRPMSEDYMSGRLGEADRDCFNILLAHNPLFFGRYAQWGADLTLSGHFHGGTIRIPGLGGLMTPQLQFFSPYARGRLKNGDAQMIVSGGLGTHSINIRLFNFPQLVNVVIRCKKG